MDFKIYACLYLHIYLKYKTIDMGSTSCYREFGSKRFLKSSTPAWSQDRRCDEYCGWLSFELTMEPLWNAQVTQGICKLKKIIFYSLSRSFKQRPLGINLKTNTSALWRLWNGGCDTQLNCFLFRVLRYLNLETKC